MPSGKLVIRYDSKTGERTMEVVGVTGPSCQDLLQRAERVVGEAGERQVKDEFHDVQTNEEGAVNAGNNGGF
jgi:ribulose 1,5-bisphosphate carboxylase large subunit-like protein